MSGLSSNGTGSGPLDTRTQVYILSQLFLCMLWGLIL